MHLFDIFVIKEDISVCTSSVVHLQKMVKQLSPEKKDELIESVISRFPDVVQDLLQSIMTRQPSSPSSPPSSSKSSPSWCKCSNCLDTPQMSDLERKCCGCLPDNCLSVRPVSNIYIDFFSST